MNPDQPEMDRRRLLQTAAGLAITQITTEAIGAGGGLAGEPQTSFAVPAIRTPGKPGDFDFLAGNWRISHRRLKSPAGSDWDEFAGEATCWTILGGIGSVEELRIPARNFSGMGLRLLDVEKREWNDFWVNAKSGVLTTPGMTGSFEEGVGIFIAEERDGEKPILARGVWDRITPRSCRWHQAISRDGGKTWQENWFMDWVRA